MADSDVVLGEVERFARRVIEPAAARNEAPMDERTFAAALAEADALGLLSSMEPTGLGPWEELDGGEPVRPTLDVLRALARMNAGFAFALHQRALARVVARRASWEGALSIVPEGSTRLGRVAFARLLRGIELAPDDHAILADVYGPSTTRVFPLDSSATGVVTPVLEDGALVFQLHAREDLRIDLDRHAHGLDELPTAIVAPLRDARAKLAMDAAPVFAAHQLALVAIATGAVERAHGLARRFAAQRRQGGALIDRHPAVLALLGKTRAVLESTIALLAAHGSVGLDVDRLFAAMAFRAETHPALAEAAHAALQVFGGLGYMRDTGLEKVARDVNHLRAMAGTPPELALIAAEGERLHG